MAMTKMDNCKFICPGSEKDPCGDAKFYTVYEQEGIMLNIFFY